MDQWALGCWGLASQTPPPMEGNSPAEIQCIPSLAFVSLRAERAPDPSSEANSGHLINACSVEAELGLAKPRQGRRPEARGPGRKGSSPHAQHTHRAGGQDTAALPSSPHLKGACTHLPVSHGGLVFGNTIALQRLTWFNCPGILL